MGFYDKIRICVRLQDYIIKMHDYIKFYIICFLYDYMLINNTIILQICDYMMNCLHITIEWS